ncbi:MAG: hypothetical protein ACI9HK_001722 [Pirellulaceae bacterium]|jgi:hypothetical protein
MKRLVAALGPGPAVEIAVLAMFRDTNILSPQRISHSFPLNHPGLGRNQWRSVERILRLHNLGPSICSFARAPSQGELTD